MRTRPPVVPTDPTSDNPPTDATGRTRLPAARLSRRGLVTAAVAVGAPLVAGCGSADTPGPSGSTARAERERTPLTHPSGLTYGRWLRPSSHLLDAAGTKAVLVEFLDFECEACGGIFPVMEQLRRELRGDLTYAIRYFPLAGHRNSQPAARAAEAAARQGRLEPMYQQLFRNQQEWAEQQGPVDAVLRKLATAAGVDMKRWERDRASTGVARRVALDAADAAALKLQGTPSFFLNGKLFKPKSPDDIRRAVPKAAG